MGGFETQNILEGLLEHEAGLVSHTSGMDDFASVCGLAADGVA
jgi:hypothetical protein